VPSRRRKKEIILNRPAPTIPSTVLDDAMNDSSGIATKARGRVRSQQLTYCRGGGLDENNMARPLRIEYPGAFYHVTSRGIERRSTFHSDTESMLVW